MYYIIYYISYIIYHISYIIYYILYIMYYVLCIMYYILYIIYIIYIIYYILYVKGNTAVAHVTMDNVTAITGSSARKRKTAVRADCNA